MEKTEKNLEINEQVTFVGGDIEVPEEIEERLREKRDDDDLLDLDD